nr:type VI secretion system PAAR protein [uncultured Halomonas sp.]
MGRKIVLVGDLGTDHEGFHPSPVIAGSPTTMIDGKPVARQGDPLAPHDKPGSGSHPRAIAAGSTTILVDGKPLALTGDPVDCGGVVIGSASGEGGEISRFSSTQSSFATAVNMAAGAGYSAAKAEQRDTAVEAESFMSSKNSDNPVAQDAQAQTMSEKGTNWLKDVEQLRLQPYDDQTGDDITRWTEGATIGYGHLITKSDWELYKDGINKAQADQLFEDDLAPFEAAVNDTITAEMAQNEFDAATMLAYNIGVGGFARSSVVKLINDPQASTPYDSLESAWKAWNKSQGKTNDGLINRRNAEWKVYSQGVYERW